MRLICVLRDVSTVMHSCVRDDQLHGQKLVVRGFQLCSSDVSTVIQLSLSDFSTAIQMCLSDVSTVIELSLRDVSTVI